MSRDAAASLASWEKVTDLTTRQLHVKYVVNLLALSALWGFVALWYMGQKATDADRELACEMEKAVDAVLPAGAYRWLRTVHPESAALTRFIGPLQDAAQTPTPSVEAPT
jgi:hypothetical protein